MTRRVALALALGVFVFVGAVEAQEITTELLGVARRQGTTLSGSALVPVGVSRVKIEIPIATADYEDTSNDLFFTLLYWEPLEQRWKVHGRSQWVGGRYVGRDGTVNPPPGEFLDPAVWGGYEVRVEIDHVRQIRQSVRLVVTP